MATLTGLTRTHAEDPPKYDKRDLTYANSFESGFRSFFIRAFF